MTLLISDNEKDELIQRMIKSLNLDKHDPGEEQRILQLTSPNNNELMGTIYFILSQETDIEKKQDDLNFSVYGGWFASIFVELKRSNRPFFSQFCREIEKKINETQKKASTTYTVVFPLNFKSSNKYNFAIDGFTFHVMPFEDFESNFSFLKKASHFDVWMKSIYDAKFSYFAATIEGKDGWFAARHSRRRLQTAIGLLIFSNNIFRQGGVLEVKMCLTLLGRPQRLSNLILGSSLTFEGRNLIHFVPVPEVQEKTQVVEDIDKETLDNFFKNIKRINSIHSKEIAQILFDALKPYYEAFLWSDPTYAFFKYWHCIELCMLKDELTEKDMTMRLKEFVKLKSLFSSRDKNLPTKIDVLYSKRNDFVHESKEEFTQFDRNDAKKMSELLIDFLLEYGNNFSGRVAFKTFLNYMLKADSDLSKKRKRTSQENKAIIDFILELRKEPVIS